MRPLNFFRITVVVALLLWASAAFAAEIRLANGKPVPGTLKEATADGLRMDTPRGEKMLPWATLSLGTRYRHEPGFPERLEKLLAERQKGL